MQGVLDTYFSLLFYNHKMKMEKHKPLSEKRKELKERVIKNINEKHYPEFNEGMLHCLRKIEEQDKQSIKELKEEIEHFYRVTDRQKIYFQKDINAWCFRKSLIMRRILELKQSIKKIFGEELVG